MLDPTQSVLLLIDLQEAFVPIVHHGNATVAQASKLAQAALLLNIPIVVTEQYPEKLGRTVEPIQAMLPPETLVYPKRTFGAAGEPTFLQALKLLNRSQIVVAGVEAHICVNQTVQQLLSQGFEVHLAEDAMSSRLPENAERGVAKMRQAGAWPGCLEMILFEWMGTSLHPAFKPLQQLIL